MTMIQLIACIGMIAGLFMVLHVSPRELSDNLFSCLTTAPGSIRADINETTKRKKAGYLRREITEAQAVLAASGRADRFPMVCFTSLLCFALGACIAIAAGNAFLVPVLAVGLMLTPFWYVKLTAGSFKRMWQQNWKLRCPSLLQPTCALRTFSRPWRRMFAICTLRCRRYSSIS